jgi:molybdenum cofactor cytidylyltransferase
MEASKESDEGVHGVITGIIMASGFSRRMNREKLTLKVEGVSVIERVISAAHSSELDELLLIYQKEQIREIADKYAIKTVYNEHADKGQSAAVKLGVKSSHPDTEGFMFLVGDQPYLDPSTINELTTVFNKEKCRIVVPVYRGKRGNPVIFPSYLKKDLLALEGDSGGRIIIDKMMDSVKLVNIEKDLVGTDIDTYEEYEKIKN